MLTERLYLKSRWIARKESVDQCVSRLLKCLKRLADCDEVFAQPWLKCDRSPKEATVNQIKLTSKSFQALLVNGRNPSDFDKITDELGFTTERLWNGLEEQSATHISMTCGAYPDPEILPAANDFCIEFPPGDDALKRLSRPEVYYKIMEIVITSFDPDWARISSDLWHMEVYPGPYHGQSVGWLTYISDRYGPIPKLPSEYKVSRVGNNGNIIEITTVEFPVISNQATIKAMYHLSNILEQKGMLSPIPHNSI